MRLLEDAAKAALREAGIEVPRGQACASADEAGAAARAPLTAAPEKAERAAWTRKVAARPAARAPTTLLARHHPKHATVQDNSWPETLASIRPQVLRRRLSPACGH